MEKQQKPQNYRIIAACLAIGWITTFSLTGSFAEALGATIGLLIFPGIVGGIAAIFTKKWVWFYVGFWVIWFCLGIVQIFRDWGWLKF